MSLMNIEEIMENIPHRYPFLLIDRVLEMDPHKRITAIKHVSMNEPFFQGHFPGKPVMPGVLQIEAMAQAGAVLLNFSTDLKGEIAYFLAVDKARFRRMVVPGDTLDIEVTVTRHRLGIYQVHGTCRVGDELACEADLKCGRV